jgi:hypothetical protein
MAYRTPQLYRLLQAEETLRKAGIPFRRHRTRTTYQIRVDQAQIELAEETLRVAGLKHKKEA